MKRPDVLFQGVTPVPLRAHGVDYLKILRSRGYERILNPACGQFTLVKVAMQAGFPAKGIVASDCGFFSTVLGYFYAGKPISDINFRLAEEIELDGRPFRVRDSYDALGSEAEKAAYLIWLMKVLQLGSITYYDKMHLRELVQSREKYVLTVTGKLVQHAKPYLGIDYMVMDIRDVLFHEHEEGTCVITFPPAYSRGYEKQFPLAPAIKFDVELIEFNYRDEIAGLWERLRGIQTPILMANYSRLDVVDPSEVLHVLEKRGKNKIEAWTTNRPDLFREGKKGITYQRDTNVVPLGNAKQFGANDELTEDTQVDVFTVSRESALYYRSLWAHKLGHTDAERFFLLLLDKKVFGTVGFFTQHIRLGKANFVFENFGFSAPSHKYPNINRLLMYLITCEDMRQLIRVSISGVNRTYDLRELRTVCLSRYRHVKLNSGILKIITREKLPNDLYKIHYRTEFRPETFQEAYLRYFHEVQAKRAPKEEV